MDIYEVLKYKALGLISSSEFQTYTRLNKFGEIF